MSEIVTPWAEHHRHAWADMEAAMADAPLLPELPPLPKYSLLDGAIALVAPWLTAFGLVLAALAGVLVLVGIAKAAGR